MQIRSSSEKRRALRIHPCTWKMKTNEKLFGLWYELWRTVQHTCRYLVNVVHPSIHPSKWRLISSFLKQIQTVFEQIIILIYYIVLNIVLVLKLLTVTYCLALHQPWDSHAQQKNSGENGSYEGWDPIRRFAFFPHMSLLESTTRIIYSK